MATANNNLATEQPTALPMFTINVLVEGFPVKIEANGKSDQLFTLIERLKESGATPPAWASSTTARTVDAPNVPICPVHQWAMKKSKFDDSYFCGGKTPDGSRCKQKA